MKLSRIIIIFKKIIILYQSVQFEEKQYTLSSVSIQNLNKNKLHSSPVKTYLMSPPGHFCTYRLRVIRFFLRRLSSLSARSRGSQTILVLGSILCLYTFLIASFLAPRNRTRGCCRLTYGGDFPGTIFGLVTS